ncbi:hypothetical protein BC834DRAFT_239707 [Gloeopeniophorella convolvens]|nr:hypothetical protein BC834DRAFT_239707 [Gloeopeniophorella convolvens]
MPGRVMRLARLPPLVPVGPRARDGEEKQRAGLGVENAKRAPRGARARSRIVGRGAHAVMSGVRGWLARGPMGSARGSRVRGGRGQPRCGEWMWRGRCSRRSGGWDCGGPPAHGRHQCDRWLALEALVAIGHGLSCSRESVREGGHAAGRGRR